jgi:hypothetical protein
MLKAKELKPDSPCLPSKVYGVDFSGAKKAGRKIWIASALIVRDVLKIEDCFQAKDLPKKVIKANSWEEFVLSFGNHYPDPKQFREICWVVAGNCEERRDTDKTSQTPFSPYNRRLYRQTYYGIRDVLAPLVRDQLICVLPMQRMSPSRPWLFEICPASTLRRLGLRQPYKGHDKDRDKRAIRAHILEGIEKTGAVIIKPSALRSKILDDPDGDALDSIIAAFATFRAVRNLARSSVLRIDPYVLEGYVYV